MTALSLTARTSLERFGLKGPGAADWLLAQGIGVPPAPNTWLGPATPDDETLLVARLGSSEFFLEDSAGGSVLAAIEPKPGAHPPGVYPVLREDVSWLLTGAGVVDVLAQVCNVDFAALDLTHRPVIMTLMIGVAVLVVPQAGGEAFGRGASANFRIWCDPTFGPYLGESLGEVVRECGGNYRGVSA